MDMLRRLINSPIIIIIIIIIECDYMVYFKTKMHV